MISALGPVAADLGANRVVRGIKIPHPCGDPSLDLAGDHDLRLRLVRGSLKAIATPLDKAALFDGVAA
jgi:glycine reductase